MALTLCAADRDCPGAQVCYAAYPTPNALLVNLTQGCYCSGWYGWSGYPDCDALGATPAFLFFVASSFVLAACYYGFALFAAREGVLMHFTLAKASNASKTSVAFIVLGAAFMGTFETLQGIMAFYPDRANQFLPAATEKSGAWPLPTTVMYIFGVLTTCLAAINVAASFIEVAIAAERMVMARGDLFKRRVYVFETLFIVALIANLIAGSYSYTMPICLIFIIIITVAHARCVVLFRRLRSEQHSSISDLLDAIVRTSFLISGTGMLLICIGIAFLVESLVVGWKATVFGQVSSVFVMAQILFALMVTVNVFIILYFRFVRLRKHKSSAAHPAGKHESHLGGTLSSHSHAQVLAVTSTAGSTVGSTVGT